MTHFGIISPPVAGHIHPLSALGRELAARGHTVTCLQMIDLEEKIRSEELDFEAIGLDDHPRGSLVSSLAQLGRLTGAAALRFTIGEVARTSAMICRDAPAAIRRAGIDALLVDQMEPAGGAVAEHLGIPFITVCSALAINRDPMVPPPFTPWAYRASVFARLRNTIGYAISDWMTRPIEAVIRDYRARWNLKPLRTPDDSFSKRAQICQMPQALDFPRREIPLNFHYVGPLRRVRAMAVDFPWHRLDGRPLVYASLGTLQNSREAVFRCFVEACQGLDVQVVVSHGGGLSKRQVAALPGQPLVVPYAPQEELLARGALTLTHAGLNTVLDSIAAGVPLVAVPLTFEQPAIARRVEWTGAGRSMRLSTLNSRRLHHVIRAVLAQPSYRKQARRLSDAIRASGGVVRAANIVEQSVKSA